MINDNEKFTTNEYYILYKAIYNAYKVVLKFNPIKNKLLCSDFLSEDDFTDKTIHIYYKLMKQYPKSVIYFLENQPILNIIE